MKINLTLVKISVNVGIQKFKFRRIGMVQKVIYDQSD